MKELNFARTVWAERQLSKLCPNNNIQLLGEVLTTEDFDKQIGNIEKMIVIMNEAYERREHFLDNTHEMNVITVEELDNLSEEELMTLSNEAFAIFQEDSKGLMETEEKKSKAEPKKTKSI